MWHADTMSNSSHTSRCPFCGSTDVEMLSLFGSQLLTEQLYCRACHTPFEHVTKEDVGSAQPGWTASKAGSSPQRH